MANNDVDTSGIEQNLKRLAADNKKARNRALKKGAEYVRQKLEENTPKSVYAGEHMKDFTTFTGVNSDGELRIGFDKQVSFRAHFVELGTIYQLPQAFIQRTQTETKEEFFRIVAEELRKELGL